MDAQEAQRTAEYAQQGRRFKSLQHQFSLLQLEVQARTTPIPNPLLTVRTLWMAQRMRMLSLAGHFLSLRPVRKIFLKSVIQVSVNLKSPNLRSYLSLMMLSIFDHL